MTTYTNLPDLDTVVGTFKFTLYSDFAGLTVPTVQTIVEVGETTESADIAVGVTQLSTLELKIRDDYSTYSHGFWFKVFSGETHLRIYLNQGGSDLFYFFGVVQADTVEWEEFYISGTSRIRTVSVELASAGLAIMDTATTDWITEVLANDTDTTNRTANQPTHKISVLDLFACMLKASGLNSTFSSSDVSFIYGSARDFKFINVVTEHFLDELQIATAAYVGGVVVVTEYFDTADANNLSKKFAKLGSLLSALLDNFGIVLRMNYNVSTQRHTIELLQRGRVYSATLDFEGREEGSTIAKASNLIGDAVLVESVYRLDGAGSPVNELVWFSKKYSGTANLNEPPNYVDFDLQIQCVFQIDVAYVARFSCRRLWIVAGASWLDVDDVYYWDYSIGSYILASSLVAQQYMQLAMAAYRYVRFSVEYSSIVRKYSKFQAAAGSDHTSLNILRRTTINNGLASNVYYANKVTKNPALSEVKIEWILE